MMLVDFGSVEDDHDAREDTPLFFSGKIFYRWMDGWMEIGDVIEGYVITRPGTRGLKRASASSNFSCFSLGKTALIFSAFLSLRSESFGIVLLCIALRIGEDDVGGESVR